MEMDDSRYVNINESNGVMYRTMVAHILVMQVKRSSSILRLLKIVPNRR